jgi:Ca2+-binding RTX toxin-like protein
MQYLMNTGAIPSYDLSTAVSSSVTAGYMQQLAQADTGPMGSALVQKYMPMTGGRDDIGPETGWTSNYISTQNADAAKVMYANADAAGSVPWHFVDTNGDAVRVDLHPGLWIDSRGTWGSDALPVQYDPSGTGWTPEVAHQPSLSYVPYLLSGEHYYLDELQAQASYTIAAFDPYYRDGGEGAIPDTTQARALGWALRDISNAAYITPDGEALKGYFTTSLDNTLDKLIAQYVNGPKGDAEGQLEGWIDGGAANPDWIRPWQQDLLASAMAEVSAKGFDKADTLLGWMDNFLSGRFINGDNGFDPLFGATYTFNMASGGQALQTWADVFQQTFGQSTATEGEGASFDWAGGYAANAKAALAGVISATHSPDAIEAYGWLQSQTTAMKASYETDPNWNIAPKLADGHYLTNDEVFVQTATAGTTMTAGNSDTMLIGNVGNDTIVGGSGIAMLFGMGGDDTIKAGSGNSYLYGGDGNDRLQDGSGANYFKGGAGADVFAFTTASTGHDTINDFTKGTDRIEIKSNLNGSGITTAAQVVSNATADADGNAVIHLGPQHDIVLQGVMLHQLTSDIFTIV